MPVFIELIETFSDSATLTTGQLLELYREHKNHSTIETLALWDHMIVEERIKATFIDTLENIYNSALHKHIESLIAKSRTSGLTPEERIELNVTMSHVKNNLNS